MSFISEAERAFFRGVRKWNKMYDRATEVRPTFILDAGEPESDIPIPPLPIEIEDGKTGRKIYIAELEEGDPLRAIWRKPSESIKPVKAPQRKVVFVAKP